MASIVDHEPQRRRRMLSEPSHTGVDDGHVERGRKAKKKQSNSDVSTDVTNQRVLKRVENLGTEVKRRRHSVRRSRAVDDEHVAEERTARNAKQGGSEAIGSKNRLQLKSSTSGNQASESSPRSSRLTPNYKPSSPDRSHVSFQKNGNTLLKPELSPAVGSLSNELSPRSNRSSASTAISRRSALANNASMSPPDMSSKLKPNFQAPRAETRHRSREDGSIAWATPTDSSTVGSPSRGLSIRRVASPATSSPNARYKQVSKSPGTVSSAKHICPNCAAKNAGSNTLGSDSSRRSKGTAEVQNRNVLNRRSAFTHREALKTSSPRALAAFLRGNGTRRRPESTTDSLSTLSLPSTSIVHTRNSIIASGRLNPAYPGGRYYGSHYADGDELCQDSLDLSTAMDKVVDSIRSTAMEILSSDVEDIWLNTVQSQNFSVDTLIESVTDKLDDLEDSLFGPTQEVEVKPAKSWFPKVRMKVIW